MRRRLRRMSLDELLGRSRQEVSKVLDRTGLLTRDGLTPCDAIDVESFRAVGSRRFFAGAVSQRTPQLLDVRLPAVRNEVVSAADAVCRGRFDLLGYRGLLFGEPVDWHLDPVSGRRAPFTHWSRIDHLDYALVGDHKVVWELNRHQWMVGLGQAYRLTGDPCYADAFAAFVRQWMDANPRGMGIGGTVPRTVRRDARRNLGSRRPRGAVSLVLLLTQHASHGRGPRPRLRRAALSGAPAVEALAYARRTNPGRPERAPDPSRWSLF